MLTKRTFLIGLSVLFFFVQCTVAQQMSQKQSTNHKTSTKVFKNPKGVAIKGYDPVAYFTDNRPVKGKAEFRYKYKNAIWWFKNEKHLKMFKKNSNRYMPQYGGYCSYGISHKKGLVEADPTKWKIIDGKLYLLGVKKVVDKIWLKDPQKNIDIGDSVWQNVYAKHSK